MKPILTKTEARVVEHIAVDELTVKEAADKMCVIYQCVANHLQVIYDKLGIKRSLHALTKWYYTTGIYKQNVYGLSDRAKRYISIVLLLIFSVEVFSATFDGRRYRCRGNRRLTEVREEKTGEMESLAELMFYEA